jgi:transcriptional regulator
MYLPPSFLEPRNEVLHDLIEAYPLGAVVTSSPKGLFATHLPWVLDRAAGPLGTLRGHIARSNPHHRLDAGGTEALVIFNGPHAYVSPSLYPSKAEHGRVVPTWNYVAVHAYGTVRFVDEAEFVLRNVEALTRRHEAGRERPWSIHDAPAEYVAGLVKAVIGLEVPLNRLEGKWKLSQNREARDAEGVASGLAGSMDARDREVARLVAERLAARGDGGAGDRTGPERT